MRSLWSGVRAWAYELRPWARWGLWAAAALPAALAVEALPAPWGYVAAAPPVAFGYLLFDAHARRQRDEDAARTD